MTVPAPASAQAPHRGRRHGRTPLSRDRRRRGGHAQPGGEVLFVGTARGLETKLVPAGGLPAGAAGGERAQAHGRARDGARAVPSARGAGSSRAGSCKRYKPDVVLGVGGYASGPLVFAAALSGYPTAIQEQNSLPGFTNRMLGRVVARASSSPSKRRRGSFARRKVRSWVTRFGGRSSKGRRPPRPPIPEARQVDPDPGRQPGLARGERAGGRRWRACSTRAGGCRAFVHQTGADDFDRMQVGYAALGYEDRVEVRAFIDDMPAVLADAALVVARAGALTLAELAIMRPPRDPDPAADRRRRPPDRQRARVRERAGAGGGAAAGTTRRPTRLGDLVDQILGDPAAPRRDGAGRWRTLARPDATRARSSHELAAIARPPQKR